jgi:hypothetical protein
MNSKLTMGLVVLLTAGHIAMAESADTNAVGLYYASTNQSGEIVTNTDGTLFKLGAKAEFKASEVILSSLSNANDQFNVSLNTGGQAKDVRSLVLRVGGHGYQVRGWSSDNHIQFNVPNQADALAIARAFSVECPLRTPPGYKYFAQFIPTKSEFQSNEPVTVRLVLKNLDTRPIVFQSGGQQRGSRDNQFGFRAMYQYTTPVPDVGSPVNFGGLCTHVRLEPGKEFSAEVDLRKWFALDKAGTYSIHGFYLLDFYSDEEQRGTFSHPNCLWSEYASADFSVVVK